MSRIYTAADQLIGHTPLLELTHIEKKENLNAHIPVSYTHLTLPTNREV